MAEPNKQIPRIVPPPSQETGAAAQSAKGDTVRIVLPTRTPVAPVRRLPPKIAPQSSSEAMTDTTVLPLRPPEIISPITSPLFQPLPKPPAVEKANTPMTAAIAAPGIKLAKTQPLPANPVGGIQPAPVIITPTPLAPLDIIPRPLCWALLGLSVAIFLIQIWNYVVS
jgi:hypothetical protein